MILQKCDFCVIIKLGDAMKYDKKLAMKLIQDKLDHHSFLQYKEIAEITGLTVKGVEYHMGKAIQTLRTALNDYLICVPFLYKLLA